MTWRSVLPPVGENQYRPTSVGHEVNRHSDVGMIEALLEFVLATKLISGLPATDFG